MNNIRNGVNKVVEFLSCTILAVMTILVIWQVITRFILARPSTITEALAKYLFLWLVLFAAAYVIGKREQMAIEFFVNRFSVEVRHLLSLVSEIVIMVFSFVVLLYGGGYISLHAMNQMDSALPIPIGIVYLALPVGGILTIFYSICNIIDIVILMKGKEGQE